MMNMKLLAVATPPYIYHSHNTVIYYFNLFHNLFMFACTEILVSGMIYIFIDDNFVTKD